MYLDLVEEFSKKFDFNLLRKDIGIEYWIICILKKYVKKLIIFFIVGFLCIVYWK